ncbi:Pfs domain protein [Lasiodiplodia theobromae]|uniref:Pfs domain protein n=1 Tax=Lasiodiplodia theobromae TaxID=45133 RepID=UPI0015C2FDB8|nr:Pfs domain protein [Lasiodiplodia theobromae]KAF4541484.1 Pfs domain protein [Lasiodiplodia theobromae]
MSPTSDENRGKRRPRDDEHVDDQDSQAEDGDASPGSLKKRRIRKGLEKKFECPHEGCGKSYSRAEHLYRHQLNPLRPLKDFQHTHSQRCLETLQNYDLGRDLSMSASLFKDSAPTDQLRIELEVQGKPKDVSEIAQIFKWLSAVCRKPVPDKLLCSRVLDVTSPTIRRTEFHTEPLEPPLGTGGSGRCWNNMFKGYVLAEGFPIPERGSQRGAELPFDVMTLLGLALYPINFGQGIILKGENTALIPSVYADDENCVQWHYLEGDGAGGPLTWDRIKQHCGNIYPSKDFKLLQSKRTFVGYFPSVKVHLGTRDSGFDKVDFSGAEYDDKTAFVLGNELVGQVGTSVMNFFTAQVSAKLMVHQTAHQRLLGVHDNIMDKIRNSKDFPILLFDFKTKQGWLVSELSAILHMALAWASYQHQSADVLSNLLLPEHIKLGDNNDRQVSIRQAFVPFFLRIGQIKDQQLQRYACGIKESKDLVGYEFKEIASFEEHLHLRRSKVDVDKSGGWLRLVSSKPEMAVILCSNLEAPIQPASTQRVCPFWQTVPTDQYYLTASVSCLRQLAKRCGGEESLRLYNDIYCIPPKKDPGPGVCEFGLLRDAIGLRPKRQS